MRRIILLSLFALLVVGDAGAQRRSGIGGGFGGSGVGFNRGPYLFHYRSGYGYVRGYGYSQYDAGTAYGYSPQPIVIVQQPAPPAIVEPPPREVHPVIVTYKQPGPAAPSEGEPQSFGIILKDGSTRSALAIMASDDVLHYVDAEDRHMRISMNDVDREATLKLNRERKLILHLPAAPQSAAAAADR
jgi:hypothetical protein